ncbi:MAG TPA: bifunctional ornithine acetyltransferase/N-acetylglutamate synthase, partial [Firmicutes bacterium]|nr:bifunctional ornithine acetyltransferase/N-acetylglutamate synthase [Bacillota bacterium]
MASGVACGIKKGPGAGKDLALIVSDSNAAASGVFTRNKVKAAPVIVSMEHLKSGHARAIVATSGNANACTGQEGLEDARRIAGAAAAILGIGRHEVLVASTGVIGVRMPVEKVLEGLPRAAAALSRDGGADASQAILTTDTVAKETAVEFEIGGKRVRVGGMAKGAGMIHPDLATMLVFITTDAAISPPVLRQALTLVV